MKTILEFSDNEYLESMIAHRAQAIVGIISEFENDLRQASKYDGGPIMDGCKMLMRNDPEISPQYAMLEAIKAHWYEITSDERVMLWADCDGEE
jgi:hypothetical protein